MTGTAQLNDRPVVQGAATVAGYATVSPFLVALQVPAPGSEVGGRVVACCSPGPGCPPLALRVTMVDGPRCMRAPGTSGGDRFDAHAIHRQ
jgi:hypothetical protein